MGNPGIQGRLAKGWAPDDPLLPVSFAALANTAGARQLDPGIIAEGRPAILDALRQVGLARPWARDAACVAAADGTTAIPWTVPLDDMEARHLAGFLHTACLVTTAMITGMRDCELKELRIGCRRSTVTGPGLTRYRLAGQADQRPGSRRHRRRVGRRRRSDHAVALAEQLCDDTTPGAAVFGRFAFSVRYPRLRTWVNGPAGQRLGLAPIPGGPVNPRMMRRTLAQEISLPARRPARREGSP